MKAKYHRKEGHPSLLPCIFLLAVFFLIGVAIGQFCVRFLPLEVGQELTEYMESYLTVDRGASLRMVFSAVYLYFRYPVLVVLFGFASLGMVFIPGITILFGVLCSFSISCFTATFGIEGVWIAFATYGIRCLLTLPCYFVLAGPAWCNSIRLTNLSFGRGRRVLPVVFGRTWWTRTVVCALILLMGVCIDLMLSPVLLQLVLDRMISF